MPTRIAGLLAALLLIGAAFKCAGTIGALCATPAALIVLALFLIAADIQGDETQ